MSPVRIVLYVVLLILSVFVSILILMQEGKQQGLGALSGSAETYWSKNKGRSVEGKLVKYTTILTALLIILAAVLNMNGF